jgi:hypothetical protein
MNTDSNNIASRGLRLFAVLALIAIVARADAHVVYNWTGTCEYSPPDPVGRFVYCYPGSTARMRIVLTDDYVPGTTIIGNGSRPTQIVAWTITWFGDTYDALRTLPPFINIGFISLTLPVDSGPGNAFLQAPLSGTIDASGWNLNLLLSVSTEFCCLSGHGAIGQWQRVMPVATFTTIQSSPNPSSVGQAVTLTASVSGGSPTGSVQFRDGNSNIGTPVALVNGIGTYTTSTLSSGPHAITAAYSGDDETAPSTSSVLTQLVNEAVVATVQPVPTLSQWALLMLAVLIVAAVTRRQG